MDTLLEFKEYVQKFNYGTQYNYVKHIEPFIVWCNQMNIAPSQLQIHHIRGYLFQLQENDIQKYVLRLIIATLRNYGNMLVQKNIANERLAMELYIFGIHLSSSEALLSWQELESIYKEFYTPGIVGIRNKAILSLCIYQALTGEEILALNPEHINLDTQTIYIPQTYSGNSRVLLLQQHQITQFQQFISDLRPRLLSIAGTDTNQLFVSTSEKQEGRNITDNLRSTLLKKYPQISSYTQIRMSVLHYWYTRYGLSKLIEMAGHEYVPTSPNTVK